MNALDLADCVDADVVTDYGEVTATLRRQHRAIVKLREACQQVFDQWGHCQATKKCMEALADTEEICKSE